MILGTAGHIDHGKTALVRALTGIDTDRLPEEKRRGITIELGFAPLTLDGMETIGVVDVPGHEAFVRTMLAGATGIDLALLVVAADEGVMPQTREHLAILRLLGIHGGVIALTKCDLVDRDWRDLVEEDVRALVQGSPLADSPIVHASSTTGEGLDDLRDAITDAARRLPTRDATDLFRLPVDRAFSAKGTGTVVTGTVWSGTVREDSALFVLPSGRGVRVRGVQSHGKSVPAVHAGTRTALALVGVHPTDVGRGEVLVDVSYWPATSLILAEVALLESTSRPLRPREWVRLHLGTAEVGARVVAPGGALGAGQQRGARVILDAPMAMRAGDRFVLRRGSPPETVGGGRVVDPLPPHRRAKPWTAVAIGSSDHLERLLRDADVWGIPQDQLAVRLGISPSAVRRVVPSTPGAIVLGARVFQSAVAESVRSQMVDRLRAYHAGNPLSFGMASAEWRSPFRGDASLLGEVERGLVAAGHVELSGSLIRVSGWRPKLGEAQKQLMARIRGRIDEAALESPSVGELESEFGSQTVALLRILQEEHIVVQLDLERYVSHIALAGARIRLDAAMSGQADHEFTASELREMLGVSRKFLIPLLEYFDREGVTERRSAGRVLHRY